MPAVAPSLLEPTLSSADRPSPHDHTLHFYADEARLEDVVGDYLAAGLLSDEPVLVFATAAHRTALFRALEDRGLDTRAAIGGGQLILRDAEEALARFMAGDMPDNGAFAMQLGNAIEGLARGRARLRVYADFADVLWRRGQTRAALRVEELWNELGAVYRFELLCAYSMGGFEPARASCVEAICRAHARVVPAPLDEVTRSSEHAAFSLLQHAQALERELAERADLERELADAEEERRRAEQALGESNRMKDEFLATVSHELRAPLAAIAGWAAILKGERGCNAAVLAKGVEIIDRNARLQTRIVDDLLDVSRILSGTLVLELMPVSLVTVVADAVESLKAAAADKRVALDLEPAAEPYLILGDAERVRQIAVNLLTNALESAPEGGRVAVRVARESDGVRLGVEHDGAGYEPGQLAQVFDGPRRGGPRTRKGLGLGLTIVRHLAELHSGHAAVASAGIDRGARFTVTFPVRAIAPLAGPAENDLLLDAPPAYPRVDLGGVRVLLVDDEADARKLLEEVLGSLGAEVRSAASVKTALELLGRFDPHVVVSDLSMPAEDGYSFVRAIRRLPAPLCNVPAIALSAFAGATHVGQNAAEAGFQRHLPKPTDPFTLASAIQAVRRAR
jgi:signal transduction histidine kinase/CheY-like chemotaxis protein